MYRTWHAMRLKSGLVRMQLPATTWAEQPLTMFLADQSLAEPEHYAEYRRTSAPRFFFDPQDRNASGTVFEKWDVTEESPVSAADDIRRGFISFFSHERVNVGFPPRWHTDPIHEQEFPKNCHWSQISDFGAGDIKLVWETNRFAFVFQLVRAFWRTADEIYAELFWQLIESWREANPPETGVNWKCGQEISLRVMAWCFGLSGFGSSAASTPTRLAMLAQMIAVSAQRIESNIGYALSQRNNHGLSEAMGLWTIGALFPEFIDSKRWASRGKQLLESQAVELIYDDGSFSQHSMNYHRVMLHDYIWSIRLGDVLRQPFSDLLRDRIAKAAEFVFQLQDELTGRVPCYGQDDGALILPLNNLDYRDYRPVVQAASFLTTGHCRYEAGPWDEDLFWLFGVKDRSTQKVDRVHSSIGELTSSQADSVCDPNMASRSDFDASVGGYVTMRAADGYAVTRAATFHHRPSQADMLHVDIWWRGENIVIDPGTYSYNAPPPWNNPFAHTSFHNTVTVDGKDQMDRASRFLWLPWLKGRSYGRHVPCHGDVSCWNGEHDGYQRLSDPVTHRRGLVRLGAEHWLVVDALTGRQPHDYRLHWMLADGPFITDHGTTSIEIQTPNGPYRLAIATSSPSSNLSVTRAAADSALGWRSTYYHSVEPALSACIESTSTEIVFATLLGPETQSVSIDRDLVFVSGPGWNATASLNLINASGMPLVATVHASGSLETNFGSLNQLSPHLIPEFCRCTSF
jgi:Heparinase II/III-like protein/Heparinase II/III N-terminus